MSNPLTCVQLEDTTTPAGVRIPLNTHENRTRLSAAYQEAGDGTMTPAMCGFWLQAIAIDRDSELFAQAQQVARRLYATYNENGLQMHYCIEASMRIKAEQPRLFRSIGSH